MPLRHKVSNGSVMADWSYRPTLADIRAMHHGRRKRSTNFTPEEVKRYISTLSPEERVQFLSNLSV